MPHRAGSWWLDLGLSEVDLKLDVVRISLRLKLRDCGNAVNFVHLNRHVEVRVELLEVALAREENRVREHVLCVVGPVASQKKLLVLVPSPGSKSDDHGDVIVAGQIIFELDVLEDIMPDILLQEEERDASKRLTAPDSEYIPRPENGPRPRSSPKADDLDIPDLRRLHRF
jgi:hypothetical protein